MELYGIVSLSNPLVSTIVYLFYFGSPVESRFIYLIVEQEISQRFRLVDWIDRPTWTSNEIDEFPLIFPGITMNNSYRHFSR